MEKTFAWFADRGVAIKRTGTDREYAAAIDMKGVTIMLLSAGEIPRELAAGRIHMGVTGNDLVQDRIPDWTNTVTEIAPMGFGHADLVLSVPASWVDAETLDDLDDIAARFRAKHGMRLRIATKYHRLVRDFMRAAGVADYQLVDSQGATEGTVAHGTADMIADITSTGQTLRANHLKILGDGVILQSQATLFKSDKAHWGAAQTQALGALQAAIGA
jgi:ATP phosphoribosyltransferase